MGFQLQRPEDLPDLSRNGPGMGMEDAGDLHRTPD
jgi:hypothetical protein